MARLSFIEKLSVLFNLTKSSTLYIIILLAIAALGLILVTSSKKSDKTTKIFYVTIYIILVMTLLYTYKDSLSNMLDYMMNNLFIIIYFPNLAIYLAAIITTNIICWVSIFNKKAQKIIKRINIAMYCIITYILVLILNIINENKWYT